MISILANLKASLVQFQLALRVAIAAAVSLFIAQLLHLDLPIFVLISAVIVTDLSPTQSRQLGLRRLLTTAIGAVLGAIICSYLPANPWIVGLSVGITILACGLAGTREDAKIAGFVCGVIVLTHMPDPWMSAWRRFFETAVGIGAAWAVSYVPKLIRIEDPADSA